MNLSDVTPSHYKTSIIYKTYSKTSGTYDKLCIPAY
jgi:hypothetical protein